MKDKKREMWTDMQTYAHAKQGQQQQSKQWKKKKKSFVLLCPKHAHGHASEGGQGGQLAVDVVVIVVCPILAVAYYDLFPLAVILDKGFFYFAPYFSYLIGLAEGQCSWPWLKCNCRRWLFGSNQSPFDRLRCTSLMPRSLNVHWASLVRVQVAGCFFFNATFLALISD